MSAEFGVTISCYRGDRPLLNGCLASLRDHLPANLPVCLIVHGDMPTADLRALYGVTVLDHREIHPELAAHSFGYGFTKMIAFWHAPFERFLHIDADAVCWGDFTAGLPWRDYDFIFNEPHETITPEIQRSQYFDPARVFEFIPEFDWRGRPYFNTGIFVARRGMFPLEEYLALRAHQERRPDVFISGEQGLLNLMAFRAIAAGRVKATPWPLQAVVPVIPPAELERRFHFEAGRPVVRADDRRLIHWAGRKPLLREHAPFHQPMTFYRTEHLRRARSPLRFLGSSGLRLEELHARLTGRHGGSYARAVQSKVSFLARRLRRSS